MTRCSARPYEGHRNYIFVSYCHKDKQRVYPIIERLVQEGFRVWYDEGINPGSEWPEIIAGHLAGCAICLAMISEDALNSHNCRREINYAILKKKPFISIMLESVALSPGMMMQLSTEQSLHMYELPEEAFFDKLLQAPLMVSVKKDSGNTKLPDNGLEEGAYPGSASFSDKWFSVRKNEAVYKEKKAADEADNTPKKEPDDTPVKIPNNTTIQKPDAPPKPRRRKRLIPILALTLAAVLAVSAAIIIPAVNRGSSSGGSPAKPAMTARSDRAGFTQKIRDVNNQLSTFELNDYDDFLQIVDGHARWFRLFEGGVKEYTLDSPQNSDIVSVGFTGSSYAAVSIIGLKSDGTVVILNPVEGQEDALDGWTDVVKIAYDTHSVACLRKDGTVLISAYDIAYLDDIQSTWTNIEDIFVCSNIFGLKADGTLVISRSGAGSKYGNWKNIAAIAPHTAEVGLRWDGMIMHSYSFFPDYYDGAEYREDIIGVDSYVYNEKGHLVCLKSDGTVAAKGRNEYGQCNVSDWKDIVAVKTSEKYTIGKKSDGTFVLATNDQALAKTFDAAVNQK